MKPSQIVVTVLLLVLAGFFSFFLLASLASRGFYGLNISPSSGIAQMRDKGMRGEGGPGGRQEEIMSANVPSILPEQLPDPGSTGAGLTLEYCTQCHNLPSPKTHSAAEWSEVVDRMDRHMAAMAGRGHREMRRISRLTPDEKREVLAYLQSHALTPFSSGSLPDSESVGAQLFSKFCVQCHVLPSIELHTAEEWPKVVERMRMNMRVIGKPVITDEERDGIVTYLRRVSEK